MLSASIALGMLLLMAAPQRAQARRESTFNYPYSRVWTSAVRLLRVDFGCAITEKDKDDGYFLFDYTDHGKTFPGSVELIVGKNEDVETVRVVLQVPAMPTYVEGMLLERLSRKLEQEYGPGKEPKHPAEAPPTASDTDKAKTDPANKPKLAQDKP
jgi:hypothetical protein